MANKPKRFKHYLFADHALASVRVKNKSAYAQALGYALDNPGVSAYAIAKHLTETSHPDIDFKVLHKAVGRWRKFRHWQREHRLRYPPEK
jgi:hypothetical protein